MIQFNSSVTDHHKKYNEFVTLYEEMGELFGKIKLQLEKKEVVSPELVEQLRALHKQFLQWLTCIEKGSNNALFRLIGDEVADRGYNDYLTLKLIELIINLKTEVKIIVSNHGIQFIYAYERLFAEGAPLELNALNMGSEFTSSLMGLNIYLQTGIISKEELKSLIDDYYIPQVLLLDDHIESNTRIYIYTHAPNHFNSITDLARRFDIDIPELRTATQWSALINELNNKFFRLLEKYEVSDFLQLEAFRNQTPDNPVKPDRVLYFIENRWDETQENNLAHDMKNRQGLVQFVLICGHDKCNSAYIKSLDSDGGKISLDAVMFHVFSVVVAVINKYSGTDVTDILMYPFEKFYSYTEQFNFYSNYNAPLQNVVSGANESIIKAESVFMASDAKQYIPLRVSGAFHSHLMDEVQSHFAHFLNGFSFLPPLIPVIANVNAQPYPGSEISTTLATQINHPVKWMQSIDYLISLNEVQFEEVGPGKVLTNIVAQIKNGQ